MKQLVGFLMICSCSLSCFASAEYINESPCAELTLESGQYYPISGTTRKTYIIEPGERLSIPDQFGCVMYSSFTKPTQRIYEIKTVNAVAKGYSNIMFSLKDSEGTLFCNAPSADKTKAQALWNSLSGLINRDPQTTLLPHCKTEKADSKIPAVPTYSKNSEAKS